jgi:hypothetical protein
MHESLWLGSFDPKQHSARSGTALKPMRIHNTALKGVPVPYVTRWIFFCRSVLSVCALVFLNFVASLLLRKSTNDREGSLCIKYDPAYGAIFEKVSVYKEACRNFAHNFHLNNAG